MGWAPWVPPLDPLVLKGPFKSPCHQQLLSNEYRQEKCDNRLFMSKGKERIQVLFDPCLDWLFLACISRLNKDLSLKVICPG